MNKRFFIAWILSAALMYLAFYIWHGLVLTDLYRISFPKTIFLIFAAITYFVVSFVLYKVFEFKIWNRITNNVFVKGILSGALVGGLLFIITTVVGISFTSKLSLTSLVLDLGWQIFEQTLGGLVVALCHAFIFIPDLEAEKANN